MIDVLLISRFGMVLVCSRGRYTLSSLLFLKVTFFTLKLKIFSNIFCFSLISIIIETWSRNADIETRRSKNPELNPLDSSAKIC